MVSRRLRHDHEAQSHTPHAPRVSATRRDSRTQHPAPREDMPSPHARREQERRRERERQRRLTYGRPDPEESDTSLDHPATPATAAHRRRAATTCGWCHASITPKARGPVPKWCSASCRQRAWEQRRAAASGLSAVEVVERVVRVPVAPSPAKPQRAPRNQEWHALLRELTRQLAGHHVQSRHLTGIAHQVRLVTEALDERGMWSNLRWTDLPRPTFTRSSTPRDRNPGVPAAENSG